jgi:FAD/FMN-containing dehydrogenase
MANLSKKRTSKRPRLLLQKKNISKGYFLLIPVVILLVLVIGFIKKIEYLSADPVGEKDCSPFSPRDSMNISDTLTVTLKQLQRFVHFFQRGGTINDASCLNRTNVYGIIKAQSVEDIQNAIVYAKDNKLKISIAGVRHSMGGQAFAKDAIVLDMTHFNQMSLDKENEILNVQSGATWHAIQNFLNPENLAVKSMQSVDKFTIGGTISVNAHGMDNKVGAISSTIRSLRLIDSNGYIQILSRTQNPQLFKAVIGGYGLFGVILDAQIDLTNNIMYKEERQVINYKDFPQTYQNTIANNDAIGLSYAHFSLTPQSYLKDMIVYKYAAVNGFFNSLPSLQERSQVKVRRLVLNGAKTGSLGKEIEWLLTRYVEPYFQSCYKSRNQAMSEPEACFISRNQLMHDSDAYLQNDLKNDTDILQEYFFPRSEFIPFIDGIREILERNQTNVINASIRVVNKEDIMLNYAPEDMFALVLYINQKVTPEENAKMEKTTGELIDYATKMKGTFYLPYQLYYSRDQLKESYPNIDSFFALKKQTDPNEQFVNNFYLKYSK